MTEDNRPWSEVFKEAADVWVDLESAASLLEDTKSAIMAQKQSLIGDTPINRAEQIIKAQPEWMEHLKAINEARRKANAAKVKLEYIRMKHSEHMSMEANHRAESRL